MQYILEQFGVAVAAITGVLAGRGKQVDLFGVLVLAVMLRPKNLPAITPATVQPKTPAR